MLRNLRRLSAHINGNSLSKTKIHIFLLTSKYEPINTRSFHATPRVYGRKTGSSALEPGPRSWSKSQMKRHAAAVEARNKKIKTGNFGKNKMQEDAAMRKMQGPDMTDYLDKLQTE